MRWRRINSLAAQVIHRTPGNGFSHCGYSAKFSIVLSLLLASTPLAAAEQVYAMSSAGCQITLEADAHWSSLRVRAQEGCLVSAATLEELLGAGLAVAAQRQTAAPYSAIALGRLLHYPWLVSELVAAAAATEQWDSIRGRAKDGQDNRLVAQLLSQSGALQGVRDSLAQAGYRVTAVSVEKVLVSSHAEYPQHIAPGMPGKLPFDAQVWLVIEP
jgi:hypothetical protein